MSSEHAAAAAGGGAAAAPAGQPASDPVAIIRSRPYLLALVLAAVLGAPISAVAYGFLALVDAAQQFVFVDLPQDVFTGAAQRGGRCRG